MNDIIEAATPLLLELMGVALMGALGWLTVKVNAKFGIEIEAKHRDSLHSALMSAARLAASRQLTGPAAIALMLDYVKQSVPDALKNLSPSPTVLRDLAEVKLQQVAVDALEDLFSPKL